VVHLALLVAQEVREVVGLLEVQEPVALQEQVVHLALLVAQEVREVVDLLEVQELVDHLVVLVAQEALELQELQVWVVHIHYMKLILKYHMDLY
jgi:hypothetical protein